MKKAEISIGCRVWATVDRAYGIALAGASTDNQDAAIAEAISMIHAAHTPEELATGLRLLDRMAGVFTTLLKVSATPDLYIEEATDLLIQEKLLRIALLTAPKGEAAQTITPHREGPQSRKQRHSRAHH